MLKGKVALITGSTRGIGWACAEAFAKNGATILLNGVADEEIVRQRADELASRYGVDAQGFCFDIADADAVKDCYRSVHNTYKGLDILVNNAGIMEDSVLGMITSASIERSLGVNVEGVIINMQYASRLMARNGGGSIVNLSSIIGRFGSAGQVLYSGTKAAVIGLTLSAAKELASQNIRVNAVAPGLIDTDLAQQLSPEARRATLASIKMNRIGIPEDVANAILFFASDLSTYVTGQVLGVDGGMVI